MNRRVRNCDWFESMKSQLRNLLRPSGPRTAPELSFDDYVAERVGIWMQAPPVPGALVFLGDSQIERGHWSEWFWRSSVLNRGIGGENIKGVGARLDEVTRHDPPLIVIECGANNMGAKDDLDEAARDFEALLATLRKGLPSCILWTQGVLPINPVHWRELPPSKSRERTAEQNARVKNLNERIEKVSREADAHFLDLHPFFEQDGALRSECTLEGLHLNGVGYGVWREAIHQGAPPEIAPLLNRARG